MYVCMYFGQPKLVVYMPATRSCRKAQTSTELHRSAKRRLLHVYRIGNGPELPLVAWSRVGRDGERGRCGKKRCGMGGAAAAASPSHGHGAMLDMLPAAHPD